MSDLTEAEKKIALIVIREMDKNARSLKDLERGADAVLKVFREVTAAPRPHPMKSLLHRLIFPFSKPMALSRRDLRDKLVAPTNLPVGCLKERFVTTAANQRALVRYTWGSTPDLAIVKVQVIVELEQGTGFDTIAGETPGPFSSLDVADQAAMAIATSWFTQYRTK